MSDVDSTRQSFTLITTVMPVSNLDRAKAWTSRWLGEADMEPIPGVAEWKLTDDCWLQLLEVESGAGGGTLRLGVTDLDAVVNTIANAGVEIGPRVDIGGFLAMNDFADPDGNTYSLIMELE